MKMDDWQRANPVRIRRALAHAQAKPTGGWFVVGGSRALKSASPCKVTIANQELVVWSNHRTNQVSVGPGACPHMGAHLGDGHVNASGCIVCPWHGLALADGLQQAPSRGQGSWSTFPAHDDGVLTWVQLDPTNDLATSEPIITKRPDTFIDAVMQRTAVCEPQDVIANRLDPWHGVHFHPYAFAHLEVVEQSDDAIDVNVGYRLAKRVILDVQARFDCPDANTIVMTITGGEGMGSVVETHATPVTYAVMSSPTRGPITLITEATLATSERHGFVHAKRGAVVMRPFMKLMAARLWRDDAKYAERLYELRSRAT